MTIKIGFDIDKIEAAEPKAVEIDMWYDRHRRNWVLYPVDAEGNQLAEATYVFGKENAVQAKEELEREYGIRKEI